LSPGFHHPQLSRDKEKTYSSSGFSRTINKRAKGYKTQEKCSMATILVIDDDEKNISAAKTFGLHTIHYKSFEDIVFLDE